ncbi:unnamed protein product [Dovyalis caffra]|uniref:Cellulose synthase n=1 Tax=Dovyalis caffra TaxID=77055 RepID=A0AAV1SVH5_9ROSI|nr:unnamed protein product [Dovyalis caffra]
MEGPSVSSRKLRRPLTQRSKIHAALLCSYWFLSILRMVSLGLFLEWRIKHPNDDAIMFVICETWFAFTWLLDQLPKLFPVNRSANLEVLKKFDLPGIDVFVSTADPEKEPPLVTTNTILSILVADYPVEKLSWYISDDGGALVTFKAMAKATKFTKIWVPFYRKHDICPRNPESYFNTKRETCKTKLCQDFVREHRYMKREYDEFKVQINALPCILQQLSDVCNSEEVSKGMKHYKEIETKSLALSEKATWMVVDEANSSPWPGTWMVPAPEHSKGDHVSIIQVYCKLAIA